MGELTVVRFSSNFDGDPYRCDLPNDQSGEYYRKSDADAELERLRADALTYAQAKAAIKLFEHEYVGQDQGGLWSWAIDEARKG